MNFLGPPAKAKKSDGKITKVYFQCNKENIGPYLHSDPESPLQITAFEGSDSSTPDDDGHQNKDTEEFEIIDCHFKEITVSLLYSVHFGCLMISRS